MKNFCFVLLAYPVMLVAIAMLSGNASVEGVLSAYRSAPLSFSVMSAIQIFFALGVAIVIAQMVSVVGSIMRWFMHRMGGASAGRIGPSLTAEGMIFGLAVVGIWLGWAPKDIYPCREDARRIEIRRPSLIEGPFGLHGCSDVFVPVTLTYQDEEGLSVVQGGYEDKDGTPAQRVLNRTIRWGTNSLPRVVVELPETGDCLFFPEPIPEESFCPPESAIEAYLRGEPVDVVKRMCREAKAKLD